MIKLKTSFAAVSLTVAILPMLAAERPVGAQDEVILHAWSWSLDTIASNMKKLPNRAIIMYRPRLYRPVLSVMEAAAHSIARRATV